MKDLTISQEEIKEIQELTIITTIDFFKRTYKTKVTKIELNKIVKREEGYVIALVEHNNSLIKQKRFNVLKKEIIEYYQTTESERNAIRHNEDGYVTNSRPENLVDDYFVLTYYYFLHEQQIIKLADVENKTKQPRTDTKSLEDLFKSNKTRIDIIREALEDLNITHVSSERTITGFINACKEADALPSDIDTSKLFRLLYFELGKTPHPNSKPRDDKGTYDKSFEKTKRYFKKQ